MMKPTAKLLLPPSDLSSCVFAAIYRDTRGAALPDADRFNHFPASPLVCVTAVGHGELRFIAGGADRQAAQNAAPSSQQFVLAPQSTPVTSWSPGDVTALTVAFYHDGWLSLGGEAACTTPPAALAPALRHLNHTMCEDLDTAWDLFCDALRLAWKETQPETRFASRRMTDWVHAVMRDAALSSAGRSLRSFERMLKRKSGHTKRALDFFTSFEALQHLVKEHPDHSLAELALAAGYADQSHMGRVVRRATGFSPAKLNQAIAQEEAFWCYRLLGEAS